jgi:hypothetical protein
MAKFQIPDLPVTPSMANWARFAHQCENIHDTIATKIMAINQDAQVPMFPMLIPESNHAAYKDGEIALHNHLAQVIDQLNDLQRTP